jgi:hypothetical protein
MKSSTCLALILFCLLLSSKSSAQYNDAQFWENVSLDKDLLRQWNLHFNHEGRIVDNDSRFVYGYGDLGLTYKFNRHLKFSADYVIVFKQTDKRFSTRHQWYLDYTYKWKVHRFEIAWRQMFQQQVQDIYSSDFGTVPDNYLRNKFTFTYNIKKGKFRRLKPYTAAEFYYRVSNHDEDGYGFNRNRYYLGAFYSFNKKTELEVYDMIERNYNIKNPPTNYVVGLGVSRSF